MTKKTRTRKTAIERKKEIVEVAIKLAATLGPDRLTTEKLALEIGISQAAIFRHYPTKSDIWNAVASHIGETMKIDPQAFLANAGSPTEKLRSLVSKQLAFIQSTPAIPDILFSRELHANNEKLRLFFVGMMGKRQALFASLVGQEIATGKFRQDLDADDASWLILSLIQGQAMRWSLEGRNFNLQAEGQRLFEIMINGFRSQEPSPKSQP